MEARYATWRKNYLRESQKGSYCFYNAKGDHGDAITCSEAHGYAMLISVLHRNQHDFDECLRFFLEFKNHNGFMKWQIRKNKAKGLYVEDDAESSATDGDIDIATSLYLAGRVFGNSPAFTASAYVHEANKLSSALLRHVIHPKLGTPLLGDWANQDGKENKKLYDSTRTSDFILSSFLLFHRASADQGERSKWQWVLESTLTCAMSQARTGVKLLPDFLLWTAGSWRVPDGKVLESKSDGTMSWNACRTPWRLAHYYAVSRDQRIRPLLSTMHDALVHGSGKFPNVPAGLSVKTGKGLVDYSDRSFIAPAGYLCNVLGDHANFLKAVEALNKQEPSYFGDSIDLVIAEQASNAQLFG